MAYFRFLKSQVLTSCSVFALASGCLFGVGEPKAFKEFQKQAEAENSLLEALDFPTSPEAVEAQVDAILEAAQVAADAIAGAQDEALSFENTVLALDDLSYELWSKFGAVYLMKETSPDAAVREAGTAAVNRVQDWEVAFSYRKDVYDSVKAFAGSAGVKDLEGEALKYFEETMRGYRRKGFDLEPTVRDELEAIQKEISRLATDFRNNVRNAEAKVVFTAEELDGVPEEFLAQESLKTADGNWELDANVTYHYMTVAKNAKSAQTRERFYLKRNNRARAENLPLLKEIVVKRQQVAEILGYASWADFRTEVRMAGSEARVREMLDGLAEGLEANFQAERARLLDLKRADVGGEDVVLNDWDRSYYANQLKKIEYDIDTEALRRYFPYDAVLQGMFELYEYLFGIEITPVTGVDVWEPSVTTYVITSTDDGRVLGLFYLDMFPREGKYNHFASFGVVDGKRLQDGRYRRPVNVLVCNFPPATEERPSLLSFTETETLFHEFGHLLHALMTTAEFSGFAGTSVPRDFVEAPSQMLEFWLEDKAILDRFAADYEDPSKKLPVATLERMIEADKSTIASRYRGQVALGMMDLNLHTTFEDPAAIDVLEITQSAWEEYYAPMTGDTAFVAAFSHLMGYDAGYYGYIWSEVIAADMAHEFAKAPKGYLDAEMGRKLRKEIYEVGDSRDVNVSIESFLGRPMDSRPFFESVGLGAESE